MLFCSRAQKWVVLSARIVNGLLICSITSLSTQREIARLKRLLGAFQPCACGGAIPLSSGSAKAKQVAARASADTTAPDARTEESAVLTDAPIVALQSQVAKLSSESLALVNKLEQEEARSASLQAEVRALKDAMDAMQGSADTCVSLFFARVVLVLRLVLFTCPLVQSAEAKISWQN